MTKLLNVYWVASTYLLALGADWHLDKSLLVAAK